MRHAGTSPALPARARAGGRRRGWSRACLFDIVCLKFGVIPTDSPLSACHLAAQTLRLEHPGPHTSQGSQVIHVRCVSSPLRATTLHGARAGWPGYLVLFPFGDQSVPDKTRLKTRSITELAYFPSSWAKNVAHGNVSHFCLPWPWVL